MHILTGLISKDRLLNENQPLNMLKWTESTTIWTIMIFLPHMLSFKYDASINILTN